MEALSLSENWILFGAVCVLIELFVLPAYGALIIGAGAVTTGLMINIESLQTSHYLIFILSSLVWAPIILKAKAKTHKNGHSSDMIGKEVVATTDIKYGALGSVSWSGTVFNAKLCDDCKDHKALVGSTLIIVGTSGNTLVCKLK